MARPVSILDITETERTELQRRLNSPTTAQRDSLRAAIVLRRGEGITQQQVAEQLGVSKTCVNKWSQRFEREGLEGLEDRKGRGRPASIPAHKVEQVITRATQPPIHASDGVCAPWPRPSGFHPTASTASGGPTT
jgi:transposase